MNSFTQGPGEQRQPTESSTRNAIMKGSGGATEVTAKGDEEGTENRKAV